ncbi:MAG: response regulator transcription factor [Chloroflexi bacterium]|nr:response regulator transcription factor [Chloroflexota bacterium]
MRILVAEDEVEIAKALKVMLERNRYSVDTVHNGIDALDYITTIAYDAIVLDIMMPGMDGFEVLAQARAKGVTTPVLFLTAKGQLEDRVAGLNAGADDYLPKPFATSELIARVKALTRRSDTYTPVIISFGDIRLDCNAYELSCGGEVVRLNNKEYQMMELFMRHPHQLFSTEHLMERIWDLDSEAEIDVVWTYIGFLRRKLKQLGAGVEIRTVRGAGFSLEKSLC